MTTRPGLPEPRGEASAAVVHALETRLPGTVTFRSPRHRNLDALGDDVQLALWCCYALHYHGFAGVPDDWEWEPEVLRLRARLESAFLDRLRDEIGGPRVVDPRVVPERLDALATGTGPSLSRVLAARGAFPQMREFLVHRSVYQTKEADPHTWAIPRVSGAAKAALVEIQHDEYGAGDPAAVHATLFRSTLEWAGVDLDAIHASGGTIVDHVPASTLVTDNLVSGFGLHRARRAECLGHLALFEMTSTGPMGRYAATLRRLGAPPAARRFYEVHVQADAVHEIVAREMVERFLADEPGQAGGVLFGARALQWAEARFTHALLDAWAGGGSSLRRPLPHHRVTAPVSSPAVVSRPGTRPSTTVRLVG
ncbi:MAG: iron-containing redox enzyme family protein [Acidimicrobiia bacterium]